MSKTILTEATIKRWEAVVESKNVSPIKNLTKKKNLIRVLENTARELGIGAGLKTEDTRTGDIAKFDPVLISLLRRTQPNLVATNLVGNQPMSGPTGLIFAQKVWYGNPGTGTETWNANRPDVNRSGDGAGAGMTTANLESLGQNRVVNTADAGAAQDPVFVANPWGEMSMSIASISVTAKARALKAHFTHELAQDLKAIHGLDAESELATILQGEIIAELDYEILAFIDSQAKSGGTIDVTADTDGRWSVERYQGLVRLLDRQSNIIGQETRRGRATWIVTTPDVAGALELAGKLNMFADRDFGISEVNVTGLTYAGKLAGKWDVYIDPYATSGTDWAILGYKGSNEYDAGAYYAPYTPLEFYRGQGEDTFQPRIGFKTRYGLVANPYASGVSGQNPYFRKVSITNL
jgi:hypothetical protein